MPGFPFGPIRPNTRAGLPLTARVLVPAVRRSSAVRGSGAAAVRVTGRKGIVPAMATPDARIRRRVSSVGSSFSLIAPCPFQSRTETCHQFNVMLVGDCCVLGVVAGHTSISDGGAEMLSEGIEVDILRIRYSQFDQQP